MTDETSETAVISYIENACKNALEARTEQPKQKDISKLPVIAFIISIIAIILSSTALFISLML